MKAITITNYSSSTATKDRLVEDLYPATLLIYLKTRVYGTYSVLVSKASPIYTLSRVCFTALANFY